MIRAGAIIATRIGLYLIQHKPEKDNLNDLIIGEPSPVISFYETNGNIAHIPYTLFKLYEKSRENLK